MFKHGLLAGTGASYCWAGWSLWRTLACLQHRHHLLLLMEEGGQGNSQADIGWELLDLHCLMTLLQGCRVQDIRLLTTHQQVCQIFPCTPVEYRRLLGHTQCEWSWECILSQGLHHDHATELRYVFAEPFSWLHTADQMWNLGCLDVYIWLGKIASSCWFHCLDSDAYTSHALSRAFGELVLVEICALWCWFLFWPVHHCLV